MKKPFSESTFCDFRPKDAFSEDALAKFVNQRKVAPITGSMMNSTGYSQIIADDPSKVAIRVGDYMMFNYVVKTRIPSKKVVGLYIDNLRESEGLPPTGQQDEFYKQHIESTIMALLPTTPVNTLEIPIAIHLKELIAVVGTAKFQKITQLNKAIQDLGKFTVRMPPDNSKQLTSLIGHEPASMGSGLVVGGSMTMKSDAGAKTAWSKQDMNNDEVFRALANGKKVSDIEILAESYSFMLDKQGTMRRFHKSTASLVPDEQDAAEAPQDDQVLSGDLMLMMAEKIRIYQQIEGFFLSASD